MKFKCFRIFYFKKIKSEPMKPIKKTIICRCLWIGLTVITVGLIFNWLSPGGIPLVADHQTVTVQGESQIVPLFMKRRTVAKPETSARFHPVSELNLEQAREYFTSGGTIFIDAREFDEYEAGHITGAISVPLSEFLINPEIITGLDHGHRIVTYCDGEDCQTSIDLAVRLNEMGFQDVWFYFGGLGEWIAAGLPIVKGDKP